MVVTEQECCRWFERGLKQENRTFVAVISLQSDYVELVNVALRVERSLGGKRSSSKISDEEKNEEKESVGNYKWLKTPSSQASPWSNNKNQKCNECGKRYTGTYRRKSITCYQCGEKGHFKSECQNKVTEGEEKSTQTGVVFHCVQQPTGGGSTIDKGKRVVDVEFRGK